MPPRTRTADADPAPAEAPSSPEPVASPSLRPASESSDPAVHRLLFERQAATSPAALELIAAELAELGYV